MNIRCIDPNCKSTSITTERHKKDGFLYLHHYTCNCGAAWWSGLRADFVQVGGREEPEAREAVAVTEPTTGGDEDVQAD